jgi:lipopolysaccharide export system protein LptC
MSPTSAILDPEADAAAAVSGRRQSLERWRRRSVLIRRLRVILPVVMGLVAAMLLGWIGVRAVLTALNSAGGAVGTVHMTNARFHGRDGHDRSFVVASKEAIRDGADVNRVDLIFPVFELSDETAPAPRRMSGQKGVYLGEKKLLSMSGNVVFDDGRGAHFVSDRAVLNIADGTVRGDSAVKGDSPMGHIEASSYSVDDHGGHVVFVGNVRGHLVNQQDQGR